MARGRCRGGGLGRGGRQMGGPLLPCKGGSSYAGHARGLPPEARKALAPRHALPQVFLPHGRGRHWLMRPPVVGRGIRPVPSCRHSTAPGAWQKLPSSQVPIQLALSFLMRRGGLWGHGQRPAGPPAPAFAACGGGMGAAAQAGRCAPGLCAWLARHFSGRSNKASRQRPPRISALHGVLLRGTACRASLPGRWRRRGRDPPHPACKGLPQVGARKASPGRACPPPRQPLLAPPPGKGIAAIAPSGLGMARPGMRRAGWCRAALARCAQARQCKHSPGVAGHGARSAMQAEHATPGAATLRRACPRLAWPRLRRRQGAPLLALPLEQASGKAWPASPGRCWAGAGCRWGKEEKRPSSQIPIQGALSFLVLAGAAATKLPDLPPCFSSRRTSVMTMPRSAALSMS